MSDTTIASFSGLSSGIDTAGIITKLTQVAQAPIKLEQNKADEANKKLSAWQELNVKLASLQIAAANLTLPTTFNSATASSSNTAAATITALPGATIGDHSLSVTQLAQAQKIVSKSFASGSAPLGEAGSFTLNGKTIALSGTDALNDVAVKINAAKAGVTASVVNVGPNDFRMTLTSNSTGTANTIAASDIGGATLNALGLVLSNTAAIRQPLSYMQQSQTYTGAASLVLGSATQAVAGVVGMAAGNGPQGTVHITNGGTGTGNEADVAINLNTDSLTTIANSINAAGISGVTAQVVSLPDANGNLGSNQQLQIVSSTGTAPSFTDSNNVLSTVGVLQGQFTTPPIVKAQDAQFNLDGINLTRSSNVVGDVLPGATIKLQSAGMASAPAATTLSITQNTDDIIKSVTDFATAFNGIQDFVTAQNQFTAPSGPTNSTSAASPPLFGDTTLTQIQDQLTSTLNAVSGSSTLASIGVTLDGQGHLNVDSPTLTNAIQTNSSKVSNLFRLSGTADDPNVRFVTATAKTQATNGAGYGINVTRAATQSSGVGAVAQTAASQTAETLTFGGALFSTPVSITLAKGNQLQDTVNQINSNSNLNGQVYASIDPTTHALSLASLKYGSNTGFSVSSNQPANPNTSGLGATTAVTQGVDVQGTINGEPATGQGRTLTGNAGNATTEGMQVLVSAPAAGAYGHVTVTHGVADSLGRVLTQIVDGNTGPLVNAENSLNTQITDTQQQIQQMNDQVSAYGDYLRQMFSDMETRVSELQSQGSAFAAQIGTTSTAAKK